MIDVSTLAFIPGTSAGPLDPQWVEHTQRLVGHAFDPEYLAFMGRQNGGPLRRRYLPVNGNVKVVERFLCLVDPRANPAEAIYDVGAVWSLIGARIGPSRVPFAVLFPGDFLCFDHGRPGPPSVVWWKHEARPGATSEPIPVAPSFTALLDALRLESEVARPGVGA